MTPGSVKDMASSVRGRLLNLARQTGKPFEEVLILYGLERFLFRLSQSAHKNDFILKGGLLLVGMGMSQVRLTRDIDLLGLMSASYVSTSMPGLSRRK
jgi:predicted nucleotidyltransferase component of viral defense system